VGIVYVFVIVQFYNMNQMLNIMLSRVMKAELKWILLALVITFLLVSIINNFALTSGVEVGVPQTFLGLNLFLEILVFFSLLVPLWYLVLKASLRCILKGLPMSWSSFLEFSWQW